ncbi:hypothetical protein Y032_0037g3432 [Ancylostoma ceylanicum]|uniref:Uncharacterized protein n=1 Tax=Ancylostoma ceylanicum TaxID=53326 RepID=A0A016UIS2_9BILA|nr:hypothetical protein Y032_0037g3432 [Ancylostoma ceylanicum]
MEIKWYDNNVLMRSVWLTFFICKRKSEERDGWLRRASQTVWFCEAIHYELYRFSQHSPSIHVLIYGMMVHRYI